MSQSVGRSSTAAAEKSETFGASGGMWERDVDGFGAVCVVARITVESRGSLVELLSWCSTSRSGCRVDHSDCRLAERILASRGPGGFLRDCPDDYGKVRLIRQGTAPTKWGPMRRIKIGQDTRLISPGTGFDFFQGKARFCQQVLKTEFSPATAVHRNRMVSDQEGRRHHEAPSRSQHGVNMCGRHDKATRGAQTLGPR